MNTSVESGIPARCAYTGVSLCITHSPVRWSLSENAPNEIFFCSTQGVLRNWGIKLNNVFHETAIFVLGFRPLGQVVRASRSRNFSNDVCGSAWPSEVMEFSMQKPKRFIILSSSICQLAPFSWFVGVGSPFCDENLFRNLFTNMKWDLRSEVRFGKWEIQIRWKSEFTANGRGFLFSARWIGLTGAKSECTIKICRK